MLYVYTIYTIYICIYIYIYIKMTRSISPFSLTLSTTKAWFNDNACLMQLTICTYVHIRFQEKEITTFLL